MTWSGFKLALTVSYNADSLVNVVVRFGLLIYNKPLKSFINVHKLVKCNFSPPEKWDTMMYMRLKLIREKSVPLCIYTGIL